MLYAAAQCTTLIGTQVQLKNLWLEARPGGEFMIYDLIVVAFATLP